MNFLINLKEQIVATITVIGLLFSGQLALSPKQPVESLGAVSFVSGQNYRLAGSGIGISDTSITLQSFKLPISNATITMAMFGTTGYATIEPNSSKKEFVSFTGVTQNADGTATLSGVTRGLRFVSPYTQDTTLRQTHSGGAILVISNSPQLYNELAAKSNNETITGLWTFPSSSPPTYSANPTLTDSKQLASKGYVDGVAFAGVSDGSETSKGIFEGATQSELQAGTAAGSTGAALVAQAKYFNSTSSATTTVPVTKSSGKLSQGFLDLTEPFTFTTSTAFSNLNYGVVVASGTNAITSIAPGTSGNMLVSNGSAWSSARPTGAMTQNSTSSVTVSCPANTTTTIRSVDIPAFNKDVVKIDIQWTTPGSSGPNTWLEWGGTTLYRSSVSGGDSGYSTVRIIPFNSTSSQYVAIAPGVSTATSTLAYSLSVNTSATTTLALKCNSNGTNNGASAYFMVFRYPTMN